MFQCKQEISINKTGFASINNDKRCKIQPISRFINNIEKQWIIDKDWSDEEKVELGIVEEEKHVSSQEFSNLVDKISTTLCDYSNIIKDFEI